MKLTLTDDDGNITEWEGNITEVSELFDNIETVIDLTGINFVKTSETGNVTVQMKYRKKSVG